MSRSKASKAMLTSVGLVVAVVAIFGLPYLLVVTRAVSEGAFMAAIQWVVAVATAVAAAAAWRAARQSADAARHSREALGLIMAPRLAVDLLNSDGMNIGGEIRDNAVPRQVQISLQNRWPATDLTVEIDLGHGVPEQKHQAYLGPDKPWIIPLEEPLQQTTSVDKWEHKVSVDYKDQNRLCYWRQPLTGFRLNTGFSTSLEAGVPMRIG